MNFVETSPKSEWSIDYRCKPTFPVSMRRHYVLGVPLRREVRQLEGLQRAGRVRYGGMSGMTPCRTIPSISFVPRDGRTSRKSGSRGLVNAASTMHPGCEPTGGEPFTAVARGWGPFGALSEPFSEPPLGK